MIEAAKSNTDWNTEAEKKLSAGDTVAAAERFIQRMQSERLGVQPRRTRGSPSGH